MHLILPTEKNFNIELSCLPTIHVSVATTRCQYWRRGGGGPQVNKFEQASSDDHQVSLVGVGSQVWCLGGRSPDLMSEGRGRGGSSPGLMSGGFPCDLFHDACDVDPRKKLCYSK